MPHRPASSSASRARLAARLAVAFVALPAFACGPGDIEVSDGGAAEDPAPPPPICKTPGAAPARWFVDATDKWGLAPRVGLVPLATGIRAADLDGDGYPDVLASIATNTLRETDVKRYTFLFLNRPAPGDPAGRARVLVDATADSGLLATRDGKGGRPIGVANLGDLDGDGDTDVVACPASVGAEPNWVEDFCVAFLNDGHAHFTMAPPDELEAAGAWTIASAALLDYDRDGVLDFWPATFDQTHGMAPLLFRGRGDGTFTDASVAAGLPTEAGDPLANGALPNVYGVTACDLGSDGDQDVLLAAYGRAMNQVYLNEGGRFVERALELGLAHDDREDYTDDESYRCYCATRATDAACLAVPAPAPRTDCSFTRGWTPGFSDQPYRLAGNNFSLACGDVDDDGDLDVMSADIRHGDVGSAADPSELILNPGMSGAKFVRPGNDKTGLARAHSGLDWNEGDMTPVIADVDLDGRKDIYLTTSDYPDAVNHGWLWRGRGDGTFEDVSAASGAAYKQIHGVALVDLDRDGDLDLLAGTSTARGVAKQNSLRAFENVVGQDQNWVQLRLVGRGAPGGNVSAIGARVSVTAGGRTQVQEVSGGYGHTSAQNDLVLTFGLGAACAIDAVTVRWPDAAGTTQTFRDVRANYRAELREGDAIVRYVP